MSSHGADATDQCTVVLRTAELQVKVKFTDDCLHVLMTAGSSENYYWERKQEELHPLLDQGAERNRIFF
jgi:hypothetical protein